MEYSHIPVISIVIPAYNVAKYIAECLDSVLFQSFTDIEVICIDDHSSDNTPAQLHAYAEKDSRVRVVAFDENQGLSMVRNKGIELASGKYILFLDSDDMLAEGSLRLLSDTMQKHELDLLFFDRKKVCDIPGEAVPQPPAREKTANRVMSGPELMDLQIREKEYNTSAVFNIVRTELLRNAGLRFFPGILHEDELYTPLVTVQAGRAMYINEKIYIHRVRGNSIMTTAVSHRNVKGYVVVYTELMAAFLAQGCIHHGLEVRAKLVLDSAVRKYTELSDEEKILAVRSLSEPYRYLFEKYIAQKETIEKRNQIQLKKIKSLEQRNEALTASMSYRIGRAITHLPRKAIGFVRSCREKGLRASVRHAIRKIFVKQ